MDLLGAHMSIAGGIFNAPERGVKAGCNVIQLFTQNANQWKGKAVSDEDATLFKVKLAASWLTTLTWPRPRARCATRA